MTARARQDHDAPLSGEDSGAEFIWAAPVPLTRRLAFVIPGLIMAAQSGSILRATAADGAEESFARLLALNLVFQSLCALGLGLALMGLALRSTYWLVSQGRIKVERVSAFERAVYEYGAEDVLWFDLRVKLRTMGNGPRSHFAFPNPNGVPSLGILQTYSATLATADGLHHDVYSFADGHEARIFKAGFEQAFFGGLEDAAFPTPDDDQSLSEMLRLI